MYIFDQPIVTKSRYGLESDVLYLGQGTSGHLNY